MPRVTARGRSCVRKGYARAFFAAKTGLEKDEIATRQLHALREHQGPREKKLRLTDVHELFEARKDQA